jgi:hypothetical protein
MSGGYGKQLRMLEEALRHHSRIRLVLVGNTEDWPEGSTDQLRRAGVLLDRLSTDDWISQMQTADILLVNLGFDVEPSQYNRTSFPSKLASYSGFKKPVIFWGPEGSSVVQFALRHQMPLCVVTEDSEKVVGMIEKYAADSDLRAQCALAAEKLFIIFEPDANQLELVTAIKSVYAN